MGEEDLISGLINHIKNIEIQNDGLLKRESSVVDRETQMKIAQKNSALKSELLVQYAVCFPAYRDAIALHEAVPTVSNTELADPVQVEFVYRTAIVELALRKLLPSKTPTEIDRIANLTRNLAPAFEAVKHKTLTPEGFDVEFSKILEDMKLQFREIKSVL